MGKIIKCKTCSKEISSNAKACPECGAKNKKPIYKRGWFIVLLLFVVAGFIGGGDNSDSSVADNEVNTEVTENQSIGNIEVENKEDTSILKEEKPEIKVEIEEKVPTEYKSALKKAQIYSDTMHMSKSGIYTQLTSEYGEQFTAEAGQYAIDNVKANWNENALKKAKVYEETMAMSPSAIYDQLTSEYGEKFTSEEAQYAIDNL